MGPSDGGLFSPPQAAEGVNFTTLSNANSTAPLHGENAKLKIKLKQPAGTANLVVDVTRY